MKRSSAVWLVDSDGPQGTVYSVGGPDPPIGRGNLRGALAMRPFVEILRPLVLLVMLWFCPAFMAVSSL